MSKPAAPTIKTEMARSASAQAQSATPKPYDPVKTVDGMFTGSVLRMAYAFKDPKTFGESTKVIIAECTKKYQDALDDCEIQLLDAKWYLEQKLAQHRAQREAKAKEADAAIAKRKHDEAAEKDTEMKTDSPSKRTKLSNISSPQSSSAAQNSSAVMSQPRPNTPQQTSPSQSSKPVETTPKQEDKKPAEANSSTTAQPTNPPQTSKSKPPTNPPPIMTDDYSKPTPDVTPAITNEDFTFESMFTDALDDANGDEMDDLNIGLDDDPFGDSFGSHTMANDTSANTQAATQAQSQTQSNTQIHAQSTPNANSNQGTAPADNAFSSLLEGVEQFANQPDDSQKPTAGNDGTNANTFTGDMEMEPNIFDSFLNDEFDVGSNNGNNDFGDFGGDGEVNFDELFGDGS